MRRRWQGAPVRACTNARVAVYYCLAPSMEGEEQSRAAEHVPGGALDALRESQQRNERRTYRGRMDKSPRRALHGRGGAPSPHTHIHVRLRVADPLGLARHVPSFPPSHPAWVIQHATLSLFSFSRFVSSHCTLTHTRARHAGLLHAHLYAPRSLALGAQCFNLRSCAPPAASVRRGRFAGRRAGKPCWPSGRSSTSLRSRSCRTAHPE